MKARRYPDMEIENSLDSFGGWFGWMESPEYPLAALKWMADQGDKLPEELHELRDTIASFGQAPIEEAIDRARGLEDAFEEIGELMHGLSGNTTQVERIREIVTAVLKYAGNI